MVKRKAPEWDPNKSDSSDLDYDAVETSAKPRKPQRPKKGKGKKTSGRKAKPAKRARRDKYEGSDDEDEGMYDSSSEEASFVASSDEAEEVETNPVTGRAVRAAVKKAVKYEEVSEGEEEEEEDAGADVAPPKSAKASSLRLRVNAEHLQSLGAAQAAKAEVKAKERASEPRGMMRRRSSRISQDREEPLVALSASGRHEMTTRAGSSTTPEPRASLKRPARGGEGMKRPPSPIQEELVLEQPAEEQIVVEESDNPASEEAPKPRQPLRQKKDDQGSDFDPEEAADVEEEEGDVSDSDPPTKRQRKSSGAPSAGSSRRRSGRNSVRGSQQAEDEVDSDEVAGEAAELAEDAASNRRPTRTTRATTESQQIEFGNTRPRRTEGKPAPDYRIRAPDMTKDLDEGDDVPPPPKPARGGAARPSLFPIAGPFGGREGQQQALGGDDSDSSEDEQGGMLGMGGAAGNTPNIPKPHRANDRLTGAGGGPLALGRIKGSKALADADPLGVDASVDFAGVGGLQGHIDSLREMAIMPLLYPEIFADKGIVPPRGVLFHGPPGTGKTHLARALSNSVTSEGKKVTFYMRKGADIMSKWVGEAERQLRVLFEEARKNQPSIIFFDEIDGLAPVRSSKQDQIHATIVATLLALMDGMDGRGQVIVVGATNRPDNVDPALRRPGRFDREFYFPLPDVPARRAILEINTKSWQPPLQEPVKDQLAALTRGYSGADLRALCTEAALNAVKRTYPQIYKSDEKLVINSKSIQVQPKDFMLSINQLVPSSERSAASGAAPLKKTVEPLLRESLTKVVNYVDRTMPRKRKITALEEAMFDDGDDDGFDKESMLRHFESTRVFRPRLLLKGYRGMGQQYLGSALLSQLDGVHVQSFDLSSLLGGNEASVTTAIVQKFNEIRRNKPSIIYLPAVNIWYRNLDPAAISTFTGLLNSLLPTDQVLVLGILELDYKERPDPEMLRDLFGFSRKSHFTMARPNEPSRREFFDPIIDYLRKAPSEFPAPENRKKRKLDTLPVAPSVVAPKKTLTKEDLKATKKDDRILLNQLKVHLQPIIDQVKARHKMFRLPVIPDTAIAYLRDDEDPNVLTTDLQERDTRPRPFERDVDVKGVPGLREVASGRFFYNIDTTLIEKRLSNGYYKRPIDFRADMKRLVKDAKTLGDDVRLLKAQELFANIDVDTMSMEHTNAVLWQACEGVYERELLREQMQIAKAGGKLPQNAMAVVPPPEASKPTTETSGPIVSGEQGPGALPPITPSRFPDGNSAGTNAGAGTDGSHPSHHTNGSTVPSRPQEEDVEMTDSQQDPFSNAHSQAHAAHLQQQHGSTQGQRSQASAHTQLQPGSHLGDYHNSASTTTSGQKTSDRSSGPFTQNSNGVGTYPGPDFSVIPSASGGSQLPDTQEPVQYGGSSQQSHSGGSQPSSQHRHSSISAILNNPAETTEPATTTTGNTDATTTADTSAMPPPGRYILDLSSLGTLHYELTHRSSGLSVEQLEQVNASLMRALWMGRGNWNRNQVLWAVKSAFEEEVQEIEALQRVMRASQEDAEDDEDKVMGGTESGFGL